jgi:hypothetical protein
MHVTEIYQDAYELGSWLTYAEPQGESNMTLVSGNDVSGHRIGGSLNPCDYNYGTSNTFYFTSQIYDEYSYVNLYNQGDTYFVVGLQELGGFYEYAFNATDYILILLEYEAVGEKGVFEKRIERLMFENDDIAAICPTGKVKLTDIRRGSPVKATYYFIEKSDLSGKFLPKSWSEDTKLCNGPCDDDPLPPNPTPTPSPEACPQIGAWSGTATSDESYYDSDVTFNVSNTDGCKIDPGLEFKDLDIPGCYVFTGSFDREISINSDGTFGASLVESSPIGTAFFTVDGEFISETEVEGTWKFSGPASIDPVPCGAVGTWSASYLGAARTDTLIEDDFSSDLGWIDESGGNLYRDTSNKWLVFNTNRGETRRWLMPISLSTTSFQLDFNLNVTSNYGNGKMIVGLIETLDNVSAWPGVASSGYFAHISQSAIGFFEKYDDDTLIYYPDPLGFSQNSWYQVSIIVDVGNWSLTLFDNTGTLIDTQSGTLSNSHTGYSYIYLGLDNLSGFETLTGYVDDVSVSPLPQAEGVLSGTNIDYLIKLWKDE